VSTIPVFSHVVLVAMENHGFGQIIGQSTAPYINNTLVTGGALFTGYHAPGHPSFPNYFVLVSGSVQGSAQFQTGGDKCPPTGFPFSGANIGSLILGKGLTFKNYCENLPANHQAGDSAPYMGHHNPIPFFSNVPASLTVDFSAFPANAAGYAALPTVSLVIPNANNDMHDGTVTQGDTWLNTHLDGYAQWAKLNNSLLIIWWDEDYGANDNPPEIFYGANITPGRYAGALSHVNILRTLCDMYGLVAPAGAATATPITNVWSGGPPPALTIDTAAIAAATGGQFYSQALTASGGTPANHWSTSTGLPAGVTINAATGTLSGTPANAGTSPLSYPFTVKVTDSGTPVQTAQASFTLVVNPAPPPPPGFQISNSSLPQGQVGSTYSTQMLAVNGTGTLTWTETGPLPASVTLSSTGLLAGVPGSSGTFVINFKVTDQAGHIATATLTLVISTGPPPPPPPSGRGVVMGGGVTTSLVHLDVMAPTAVSVAGFIAVQDAHPGDATP
jgi:Phosphoesterase family/Putative Ig domain